MLLPNNVLPKDSLYYNGGLILEELLKKKSMDFFELYSIVNKNHGITMSVFIFSLDWLYLCNAAKIDGNDKVKLCI